MGEVMMGGPLFFPGPKGVAALWRLALGLAGLLPALPLLAQDSPPAVPPGFESLAEPQTTLVDIYYADQFVATQLATFTADEIEFTEPRAIVEQVPGVLDTAAVAEALSGAIPTHLEFVCHYANQPGCGELKPAVGGVIFDESRFRADLFVNSDYLAVRTAGHRKYLPASDSGWSWLQTFNTAYAGTRELDQDTYAINSNSTLAYRENRFQITGNYQNDGDRPIDTAVIRRDWQGREYQLGYFRSNSADFQFMSDSPVRGLRVASSLDTRDDLRQTAGNELQVFLPTRSEVSIFKDGRLISSRFYDPGNQILDTTQLPGGAYDVTLRIRDSAGSVEEETRFYIKSNQLPPADQALYFFEAGELLDPEDRQGFAEGNDLTLVRAGYHQRLGDQFSAMAGASQVDSHSALELGLTHLGRYHDMSIGGFTGSGSRQGARLNMRARYGDWFINANYRRLWNEEFDPQDPADLLGPSATQGSLGIATLLPFGRMEVSGRFNRRADDTIETYTARYQFPRLRLANSEMFMGFEVSREEGVNFGSFTFEMRFTGEHLSSRIRPEYARRDNTLLESQNDWQTSAVVSWHDRDLIAESDLRFDLRAREQANQTSYGAEMDWAGNSGRLRVQTERTDNNGAEFTRYNANGFTSFMVNGNSTKLGGREQSQSALLIKIDGSLADATFDVLVDGNPRGVAYPNRVTAITLRPYETYQVRLRQRGSSFVEYDQQVRNVTLYPGNVVTLSWEVSELDIVFGRILDSGGNPVTNALIHGVSGLSTTDDVGLFQAEVRRDVKSLGVETMNARCEVTIPPYTLNRGIASLGNLMCDLEPKASR